MIQEFISKKENYIVKFLKFNGSGWDDDIQKIIETHLSPIVITKRLIQQTWDYSEKEFDLEKENIKFIFHLDDEGSMYLLLAKKDITENSKQKLREWAKIIAEEIEKLK